MAKIEKLIFDFDDYVKDRWINNVTTINNIISIKDIIYDGHDPQTCVLDLFYPENMTAKMPVVLNIHGGGWITGDKYSRRGVSKLFADMGMVVVTPNYGICPQYKYHDSISHLFSAIQWIADNAKDINVDTNKFFVTGDSAGGQLACLILATQNNPKFFKLLNIQPPTIKAKSGILCCGAYDIDKMVANPLAEQMLKDMTGLPRNKITDYEYYSTMRTIDWIDENFPNDVFIVVGRNDMLVNKHEKTLSDKLDKLQKKYHIYRASGLGEHCFHLWHRRASAKLFYAHCKKYFEQMLDENCLEIKLNL